MPHRGRVTVTVDTTNLAPTELMALEQAADGLDIEFDHVSVSDRELESVHWKPMAVQVRETFMLDESRLGEAVLGSDASQGRLEEILSLLSNGSFPRAGAREGLTLGQQHQLRDPMIFEAHVRDERDIFVSEDKTAFVGRPNDRTRRKLESRFRTRIMNGAEFRAYCSHHRRQRDAAQDRDEIDK